MPLPETWREQIARGHETRVSASWRTAWFPVVCGNGWKRRVSPVASRRREGLLTEPTCMDRLQFASEAVLSEVAYMYPAC